MRATSAAYVFAFLLACSGVHAAPLRVVATVKPLHSLVAVIMKGQGEPALLIEGEASPHTFQLKPSQRRMLQTADVIFAIGTLEGFMARVRPTLPESMRYVEMIEAPDIRLLPLDGDISAHHAGKQESAYDPHLWLDAENAAAMAAKIARTLADIHPDGAARYRANADRLTKRLHRLHGEIETRMAPLRTARFIVLHDATQYFERAYGLHRAGVVLPLGEGGMSASHVVRLRRAIREQGVRCILRDPQFDAEVLSPLTGEGVRVEAIDPDGTRLTPGPELYMHLMEQVAAGFERCLKSKE